MIEYVKIPSERIKVLLGKNHSSLKKIEEETGAIITLDDVVKIESNDPLMLLKTKDIVTAIGRGFDVKKSLRLLEDECELRVISLYGETQKKRTVMKGRVIGNRGGSKGIIERETGASISIRGKTIAIIGTPNELVPAENALSEILRGKTHGYAYNIMRRVKRKY